MLTPLKQSERHAGIILEHSHVTVLEIAHTAKSYTVTAAGSYESHVNFDNPALFVGEEMRRREKVFANELKQIFKTIGASPKSLSFGLNSGMLMLQSVPIDIELDARGQKEQALWELRHFADDAHATSHTVVTHRLSQDESAGVVQTILVGVPKSFIAFLKGASALLKKSVHIVDVQHFCAENALKENYPSIVEQRTLVIGMDESALTASTIVRGAAVDVQLRQFTGDDTRMLFDFTRASGAEQMYLYGSAASYQLCESLRRSLDIPVELVDPFRAMILPASLIGLADVKARRYEFTAAVGLAMRME